MSRISWINDDDCPDIEAHAGQLEHFVSSIADGTVDVGELKKQEENLVAAMRAVEGDLSDEVHAKVTSVLAELTAYNVMAMIHDLAVERLRNAID